jgi:hypothetical protein
VNDVFACAGDETKETGNDQDRKSPLDLGAITAGPKEREGNNHGRNNCAKDEPGQFAFMGKPVPTFWRPIH